MTTTATPQKLSDLATPAFVVNRHSFRRNCELVRTSAYANGIHHLRPHVKTHKTKEGCLIQAGMGDGGGGGGGTPASTVIGFVVSTIPELSMVVDMACEHQCRPFSDIIFGLPICRSKLYAIQKLKIKLASVVNDGNIHLLVDNPDQIDFLESFILNSTSAEMQWSVFLKLDTGYHRAGTTCNGQGVSLATRIIESPHISLKGLYSHCGHSYSVNTEEEMKKIVRDDHNNILEFLTLLTDHLKDNDNTFDTSSLDISVGSTPSMFAHNGLTNVSNNFELHPGNYVFYDRQQLYTGACANESYIAGFVLTRVIGHYKDERNAIMVDAGATALTKEVTAQGDVCAVFGLPGLECYRMSQEVTMIRRRNGGDTPFPFEDFPLGSTMLLLPNHSCLAAACFDVYHVVDETESPFVTANVVDTWKPAKGWA